MLDIVKVFTGPNWQRWEIGMASAQIPGQTVRSRFPHTRILNNQPVSYIRIESAELSAAPFAKIADAAITSTETGDDPPAMNFIDSLKQLLSTYLPDGNPPIDMIAEIAGTSVRSLQRHLQIAGLNYRQVLDQARDATAIRLLAQTDAKIIDISRQLGYGEPTHFSRAFRRTAGVSPRAYRQQLHN